MQRCLRLLYHIHLVPTSKLSKVRFVPDDKVRFPNVMESGPAREKSVDDRRNVLDVLLDKLGLEHAGKACSSG